ncbi:MAG: ABC transporter substrate-binding protein [Alphaproteobacteria bacterium]|nr:ABC transporter substrate-binding protein [Alphaproteobacteria bacterium]
MIQHRIPRSRTGPSRRAFLATAGAGALLAGAPAIARAQAPTLKIGVLLPRSGFFAQAGQGCHRGALIAPAVLNEMGYRFELVHVDTESSVDIARTQAERLINEGANVLVGAFDSAQSIAIAQVTEQRGVPYVVNVAAAPQLTEQGYRFIFRNFPRSIDLVTNGLALIKTLLTATNASPQRAVFIHANDTFGQANRGAMDRLFPGANMPFQLVENIAYDPRAQDLNAEVARIRAARADLVLVTTRAGDAIKMIREMVRQRYEPMGIVSPGSPGMYDQEFYDSLGRFSEFCISNVPWYNPRARMAQPFERAFRAQFPNDKFEFHAFNAGFTLEAILIAADAFKRAGSAAPQAMVQALRATDMADHIMVGGPIKFDEKGQNNNIGSACVQNRNLNPTVVLPSEAATMPPVFPMPGWQQRG